MKPYYEETGITLYCGDCRDVLPHLQMVDHVITDPPYNRDIYTRMSRQCSLGISGAQRVTKNSGLVAMRAGAIGAVNELIGPISDSLGRLVKRWAVIFSDVESCHLWRSALLEDAGLRYVRTGAWVKDNPMPQMTGGRPAVGFEPCTIVHARGKMRWNGGGHPAIWRYGSDQEKPPIHPCPKPLGVMLEIVQQFTDLGDVILDPFAGSLTTILAAKKTQRRAIGIESNEQFLELAIKRLKQHELFKVPS